MRKHKQGIITYKDILFQLAEQKDWALRLQLQAQEPHERVSTLQRIVLAAAQEFDDETTLRYTTLLLDGVRDTICLPYVVVDETPSKLDIGLARGYHDSNAGTEAAKLRSAKAMELYPLLPAKEMWERGYRSSGGSAMVESVAAATLQKTKQLLLTEIVAFWRDVESEEHADEVMAYLAQLQPELTDDDKLLAAVIQKSISEHKSDACATDISARVQRALLTPGFEKLCLRETEKQIAASVADVLGPIGLRNQLTATR